jgi:hypothetical protein
MRRTVLFSIAFLAIGAESAVADLTITNFSRVESSFLRDPGTTSYHLPVFKTTISTAWESGWGVNLAHFTGFGRCFENETCAGAQEWELELFNNRQVGNWRMFGQVSYFALGETARGEGDVIQGKGRVQYTALWNGHVRPYLEMNYQYLVGTGGGLGLTHMGADFSRKIAPRWSVAGSADITYDSAPFRDHGWLVRGDVGVWWDWTPSTQIGVWVKARTPVTHFETTDRQGVAGGFGIKVTWK